MLGIFAISPSACVLFSFSQLVVTAALTAQVREVHDLDKHARPSGEVLRALASTGVRVVLLIREASLEPRVVDGVYQILAQVGVHGDGTLLLRTGLLGDVL